MKNLVLAFGLLLLTSAGFAQVQTVVVDTENAQKTERDFGNWETEYYSYSKAETAAFFASDFYDSDKFWVMANKVREQNNASFYQQKVVMECEEDDSYWNPPAPESEVNLAQFANAVDGSVGPYQISQGGEGFTFCFFGEEYTQFWVNANGNITFEGPDETAQNWVPVPFPAQTDYSRIASYWGDNNLPAGGSLYVEIENDHAVITWENVPYWVGGGGGANVELRNTHQIIITDGVSDVLPDGNNVGFLYQDMEWATGEWDGGANGQGGNPGVTGIDLPQQNPPGFQIGYFEFTNDQYDGPAGSNDGVEWLEDKSFFFDVCNDGNTEGTPPVFANEILADTITLCNGEVLDMDYTWISLASPQLNLTTTLPAPFPGFEVFSEVSGNVAVFDGQIVAGPDNVGTYDFSFLVEDDQDPVQTAQFDLVVVVSDVVVPQISILDVDGLSEAEGGVFESCQGVDVPLTATPGFDEYCWSASNCIGPNCDFPGEQNGDFQVTLTGFIGECSTTAEQLVEINVVQGSLAATLIPGPTIPVCNPEDSVYVLSDPESNVNINWGYYDYEWSTTSPGFYTDENPGIIHETLNVLAANDEQDAAYLGFSNYADFNFSDIFVTAINDMNQCREIARIRLEKPDNVLPLLPESADTCDAEPNGPNLGYTFEGGFYKGLGSPLEDLFYIATQSLPNDPAFDDAYFEVLVDGVAIEMIQNQAVGGIVTTQIFEPEEGSSNWIPLEECQIFSGMQLQVVYYGPSTAGLGGGIGVNVTQGCTTADEGIPSSDFVNEQPVFIDIIDCIGDEPEGSWTVNGTEMDNLFTNAGEFNTDFQPTAYGTYELCFSDEQCPDARCIELNFAGPIDVEFDLDELIICDDEEVVVDADFTNPNDHAETTINWTNPLDSSFDEDELVATISNVCFTETATLEVSTGNNDISYFTSPAEVLACDGQEAWLVPVQDANGNDLEYDWTGPGIGSLTTDSVQVSETGEYSVVVSGACSDDETVEFIVSVQSEFEPELMGTANCDPSAPLIIFVEPEGLSYTWEETGETSESIEVFLGSGLEEITVSVDYACETVELTSGLNWSVPITVTGGNEAPFIACPEVPAELCLGITGSLNGVEWIAPWGNIGEGPCLEFNSSNVPEEYLTGDPIEVLAIATGSCNTEEASFFVIPDLCGLTLYNVITPDEDSNQLNEGWIIGGIETVQAAGNQVAVEIFDRWGKSVYATSNYDNENPWKAEDLVEGTYFYTVKTTGGLENDYSGFVTVVRK